MHAEIAETETHLVTSKITYFSNQDRFLGIISVAMCVVEVMREGWIAVLFSNAGMIYLGQFLIIVCVL